MKKFLARAATIIALSMLPIGRGNAYPGGHGGGGLSHGGGGGNQHFGGNGSNGISHGNSAQPNTSNRGSNSHTSRSNTSGKNHSNSTGHPSNRSGHNNLSNKGPNNRSNGNRSNGRNRSGSSHFAYTHRKGGGWDKNEWSHAWNRHWYHAHFTWWNGGWVWWDPDVSDYVPYVEGQYIPEDYYVQGDEPPADGGGAAIRVINPADSDSTINYSINDNDYQIAPGSEQDLPAEQQWVIAFDRGENDGNAEYTLTDGEYTFGTSDHGWELYHTSAAVPN